MENKIKLLANSKAMSVSTTRYTTRNISGSDFFRTFIQKPLCERKDAADKLVNKFPDRIPVLVDKVYKSPLSDIDKHKFLVPSDITIGKFMYELRKHIAVTSEQAIFLFINNTLPPTASLISTIYHTHKNEDNFLYITYAGENVFG